MFFRVVIKKRRDNKRDKQHLSSLFAVLNRWIVESGKFDYRKVLGDFDTELIYWFIHAINCGVDLMIKF